MKHYKKRVAKIADELITYFFLLGAKDIDVNIRNLEGRYIISLKSDYPAAKREKVDRFCSLIDSPKQEGMEEYYWELTGEGDVDNELSLVGMMVDEVNIKELDDNYIELEVQKFKK